MSSKYTRPTTVVYNSYTSRLSLFQSLQVSDGEVVYDNLPTDEKFVKQVVNFFKTKKDILIRSISTKSEEFKTYLSFLDRTLPFNRYVRLEKYTDDSLVTGLTHSSNVYQNIQSIVSTLEEQGFDYEHCLGDHYFLDSSKNLVLHYSEYTEKAKVGVYVVVGKLPLMYLGKQSMKLKDVTPTTLTTLDYDGIRSYLTSVLDVEFNKSKTVNLSYKEAEDIHKLFSKLNKKGLVPWSLYVDASSTLELEKLLGICSFEQLTSNDLVTLDTGINVYNFLKEFGNRFQPDLLDLQTLVHISTELGKFLEAPILYGSTYKLPQTS